MIFCWPSFLDTPVWHYHQGKCVHRVTCNLHFVNIIWWDLGEAIFPRTIATDFPPIPPTCWQHVFLLQGLTIRNHCSYLARNYGMNLQERNERGAITPNLGGAEGWVGCRPTHTDPLIWTPSIWKTGFRPSPLTGSGIVVYTHTEAATHTPFTHSQCAQAPSS